MSSSDIFLSYNREDQTVAKRFAEGFEVAGLSVWWDVTLRSGEAYDQVTEDALRTAKAVVVLWSRHSVVSRWVRAEATLADRNRTLVPARIEPCDLPIMFELTQTADLSHWRGEASDPIWRGFLTDVRKFVAAQTAAARPGAQRTEATASSHDRRPSVAVLPFINRSGRSEDDAFADDMVEDVAIALTLNPWMSVVAASVTAAYRHGARDLRQIGSDLGARYILEGNTRRVGESLRVTAQLVEAESGNILWTGRFDRPVTELGELQEELVSEVAAHLSGQVERAEVEHALKRPENVTAWEAFVRSVAYMARNTRAGYEAAYREAKRSIAIDPENALAHTNMASSGAWLLLFRGDDPKLNQEVEEAIARARTLDPSNPAVLAGCASALTNLRKPREAMPLARRGVAINPNLDFTRASLGTCLIMLEKLDEGLAELDAADRVRPNSAWGGLASVWRSVGHLQAGRIDLALEAASHTLILTPGCPFGLIQQMLCLGSLQEWDEARDCLRRLHEADREMTLLIADRIVEYLHGHTPPASEYLGIVRKLWSDS
jgi:TolB-like protein